jgi:hypothetical protein
VAATTVVAASEAALRMMVATEMTVSEAALREAAAVMMMATEVTVSEAALREAAAVMMMATEVTANEAALREAAAVMMMATEVTANEAALRMMTVMRRKRRRMSLGQRSSRVGGSGDDTFDHARHFSRAQPTRTNRARGRDFFCPI